MPAPWLAVESRPFLCAGLEIMTADEVTRLIETGLPGARVRVASDDDTHFAAVIVSDRFEGERRIKRHQQVYATLGERMGREIHALSIEAYTPREWAELGDGRRPF
jgi:acid stress-induced BolA-like protein IbaG/YrbA